MLKLNLEITELEIISQKVSLINSIKEESSKSSKQVLNIDNSHSASIFFVISKGWFLYEDTIVNPLVIYELLEEGILKYNKRQKHQSLDSLRYSI